MDLRLPMELAAGYKSPCQRVRVLTEAWAERELFCADCESISLKRTPHNTRSVDLYCGQCNSIFQLKAGEGRLPRVIPDGAYSAMIDSLRNDRAPNLFLLRYDVLSWSVSTLVLIPRFAFPESAIVKRKPLSAVARRAGWTGCNIALDRIPPDGRIQMVVNGIPRDFSEVRNEVRRLRPLKTVDTEQRGWALEVLNCIRKNNISTFTTADAYIFCDELQILHPGNRHVRPKIRQQLQVLRDSGILSHIGRGKWKVNL